MTLRAPNVCSTQPRAMACDYPWRNPAAAADGPPPPVFSTGEFLDGLPERDPVNRHTCCEAFCSILGFEDSAVAALRGRYDRLMELCSRLPQSVPGNPVLDGRLHRLRAEVAAVKLDTVRPEQRFDALDRLRRLSRTADRLHGEVSTRAYIELQQHRARQIHPGSMAAVRSLSALSFALAPTDSGSGSGNEATPPGLEPLRQRTVRRRDRSTREGAGQASPERAREPSPYQLDRVGWRTLQGAVGAARHQIRDGGRLSGSGMLELGRTVAQLVNGRFPVQLTRNADLNARRYDIGDTIDAATRHMRPDQRDAIRAAAAEPPAQRPRP